MLIYVPLNRSCGTFSCAFYTYVLLPTSPRIFQCTFSTYVPPATFTETFWLTYSLYVPKTQGNAHEKENVPHTETFPLSLCIYFSSFVSFSLLILYSFYLQNNVSVTGDKNFMPAHSSPITNNIIKAPLGVLLSAFC